MTPARQRAAHDLHARWLPGQVTDLRKALRDTRRQLGAALEELTRRTTERDTWQANAVAGWAVVERMRVEREAEAHVTIHTLHAKQAEEAA